MQAGESIVNVVESARKSADYYSETTHLFVKFLDICTELMGSEPMNIDSRMIYHNEVLVNVFENSFRTVYADGSYVHIVVFGYNDDDGVIEVGIHLDEHAENGQLLGNALYHLKDSRLLRYYFNSNNDEETTTEHFSIHKVHEDFERIDETSVFGDDLEKQEADSILSSMKGEVLMHTFDAEISTEEQPISESELIALNDMFKFAVPFTIPTDESNL
jgi:hypothetical protein